MAGFSDAVIKLSVAPENRGDFETWIEQKDVAPFLRNNAKSNEIVIHLTGSHAFLQAVVVPKSNVSPPNEEDLMSWNLDSHSSWGIEIHYPQGADKSISIVEPMSDGVCKSFRGGEKLVFSRDFEGRQGEKHYYEILQKFEHVFDIHFLSERSAYSRLDKNGDIEDVVRIIEIPGRGGRWGTSLVVFNRFLIDQYLAITESVLVTAFDFTRFRSSGFGGWHDLAEKTTFSEDGLFYRSHVEVGHASFMRGVHVVHPSICKADVIAMFDGSVREEREYASFLAWDFKNEVLRDISTAPGSIANYFTESVLPFETSPAFFRPEVLLKYKNDSDKYRLEDRSISCRNAWHLQTYDINEAGQVHTYLIYLQRLPYEEQLYWKSFNERPKAAISKRALTTDFEGKWYTEYDPLTSLKDILRELDHAQVPWWTLRSEESLSRVHYPVANSADEWANEILQLDQMVVEGFEEKWLRKKATDLGRTPNSTFRSLKLVEECMTALSVGEADVGAITTHLRNLHDLRSKLKGHVSGAEAFAIRKRILTEHGSYGEHFRVLCTKCDETIRIIAESFKPLQ